MKKLLLVSNSAYNIYHFRNCIWKHFKKEGVKVYALAPTDQYAEQLQVEGVEFIPLQNLSLYGYNLRQEWKCYKELKRVYQELTPCAIFHFTVKPNMLGTLAASRLGIANVPTITGLGTSWVKSTLLRNLVTLAYKWILPKADTVICQNRQDIQDLRNVGVRARSWQFVGGSGIDTEHFYPRSNTDSPNTAPFRFLYLGRMLIDKGLRELFAAWRILQPQLSNAELLLLGQYDDAHPRVINRQEWEKMLSTPGVRHHVQVDDVRTFMASSDVVVLPSYREGMPRALLEAMSMEKPIISTQVPGCKILAKPGVTGWCVPPKKFEAFAEAMRLAHGTTKKELNRLGKNGRELVIEHYSSAVVANTYANIFEQIGVEA